MIKFNKIYNEDCLNEDVGMPSIPKNFIDLIITDPPFGVNFLNEKFYDDSKYHVFGHINEWIKQIYRILKRHSHCYIYIPVLEVDIWVYYIKKYFKFNNIMSVKAYDTNRYFKNNYSFDTQFVVYASKGKAKRLNKVDWIKTSEGWLRDKRNKNPKRFTYQYPSFLPREYRANIKPNQYIKPLHPNQKNQELIEKIILLSSKEGEVVLDPFSGIGSTCLASKRLRRKYLGYEIDRNFYETSIELIKKEKNIFENILTYL